VIRSLALTDFRSYSEAECTFEPGVTVLVGRNGHGKTNIVEAIGYLATMSSHRVASDAPLVRSGAERAVIRARIEEQGREVLLEMELVPGRANRAKVNGAAVGKTRDALGHLRTVLFAPEDLALIRGEPAERRRLMDELVVQRSPRMAGVRADLDRVLRQRSALLKSAGAARRTAEERVLQTLQVWDDQLAALGAELIAHRRAVVEAVGEPAARHYESIAGGGVLALTYRSALGEDVDAGTDQEEWRSLLAAAIERRRREELDRGLTLVGPQRDDLLIEIDGLPAKGYASHGESWSAALALRLASWEVLRAEGSEPVLLLDDVFAELDAARRDRLASIAVQAPQVIITAAVAEDLPQQLQGARINVVDGVLQRV
jgi:DNA replication and repair protein RecF